MTAALTHVAYLPTLYFLLILIGAIKITATIRQVIKPQKSGITESRQVQKFYRLRHISRGFENRELNNSTVQWA